MSLPAVRALKQRRHDTEITICCRDNLAAMWSARDEIDSVITFKRGLNPQEVGRIIRERGAFDEGLLLPNSFRSALEFRLGRVGNLTGYKRHGRGLMLKHAIKEPEAIEGKQHHVHRYLNLAKAMGADISDLDDLLAIPAAPTPLQQNLSEIHVGVCPGAEYGNAKRYPIDRYASALQSLRENHPELVFRISVFGSPAEEGIGEELSSLIDEPRENRAGKTSMADLVKELKTCHFVATNDTGTMHLAAALGVPTVAIFGSTEPIFTAPIGTVHRVIRHQVDCSPCFLRECPVDYRCMLQVEPETVLNEMETLLKEVFPTD
tara:strand:+ start:5183 stop:6142 length:960 start_codon:yes stop_codon:yes gene_type:complete